MALLDQSRVLRERGDYRRAVEVLEEALELWPEEDGMGRPANRLLLVHTCALAGDPERGLVHIDAALAEQPSAWLWYSRGVALTTMGDYQEAAAAFGQALILDPTHAKSLQWRAQVASLLGEHEEALVDLQRTLELIDAHDLFGVPEGEDALRRAVLLQRADALDALGRHDEARADREAARGAG